jgi:NTE family protein
VIQSHAAEEDVGDPMAPAMADEPRRWYLPVFDAAGRMRSRGRRPTDSPGIASVMVDAFNITQDRISRSRLAGDPPDVMISPKLSPVGLFEFHRAEDCIELGRQAAERALPDIRELMRDVVGVQ